MVNRDSSIFDATAQDIGDYQVFCFKANCARTTNKHLDIIIAFFKWMVERGTLFVSPCLQAEKLKEGKFQRAFLLRSEIDILYKLVKEDKSIEIRDITMFNVLIGTGIRATELCNLKVSDFIDDRGGFFRLSETDGSSERLVSMSNYTKHSVMRFLNVMKLRGKNENWIFTSPRGNQLKRHVVYDRIRKITRKVIAHKNGPNMLRDTFASQAIDQEMPLKTLQLQMGYKSLRTIVSKYTGSTSIGRIKKVFDQFHPRA